MLQKEGFLDKTTVISINATADNQILDRVKTTFIFQSLSIAPQYVIMIPDLGPGEARVMMTWATNPPMDMDMYVAAVRKSDNTVVCVITYIDRNCPDAAAEQIRFLL